MVLIEPPPKTVHPNPYNNPVIEKNHIGGIWMKFNWKE